MAKPAKVAFRDTITPDYRIFDDPPEQISLAFGGRDWFWSTGCTRFHRLGIFLGLGWELDVMRASQCEHGITGVRVYMARTGPTKGTCTLKFVRATQPHEGDASGQITEVVITTCPGVPLKECKARYLEIVGSAFDSAPDEL